MPEILLAALAANGIVLGPPQPLTGPGGQQYRYEEVRMVDRAGKPTGFWWFEPAEAPAEPLPVVLFLHGYGAYNPMIYGAWIKHLVRKGYVVIFPRYQRNMVFPFPRRFVRNTVAGLREALDGYPEFAGASIDTSRFFLIGHSYGGTIAAHLAARHHRLGIPPPRVAMLCMPGTGPFCGARLKRYEGMSDSLSLLVVTSEQDELVGDRLGKKVMQTSVQTPRRLRIHLMPDGHGQLEVRAGHKEPYAVDLAFDSGKRNYSARSALNRGQLNAVDFYGLWKWFDLLSDEGEAQGRDSLLDTAGNWQQLGTWSDGQPIRPPQLFRPADPSYRVPGEK